MTTTSQPTLVSQPDVDLRERSPLQALATAYSERLACLRCAATEAELAANARLIEQLERRCRQVGPRPSPAGTAAQLRQPDGTSGRPPSTGLRMDPALFLG